MKKLIERLKASRELEYSPVAFTVALVEKVLTTDMEVSEFRREFMQQTREAQFFFSHMPSSHIQENQRIFAKEFTYADSLTQLARRSSMDHAEFQGELCKCIEAYLAAHEQN